MKNLKSLPIRANCNEIIDALEEDGCVVIEGAMSTEEVDRFRNDLAPFFEKAHFGEGQFVGGRTKRLGGLFAKSPASRRLAICLPAIATADAILSPNCNIFQINLTQAVEIHPGESDQILHRDEGLFDFCQIEGERMFNVIWALTPFDETTGATKVVPGSHKWPVERQPEPHEIVSAKMQPGSMLIWLGSLLHGGGANQSEAPRLGAIMSYNLGWLRQAENQSLTYPPHVAREFPEMLQELIGYAVHRPNVGLVENDDPMNLLGDRPSLEIRPRDFLTSEGEQLLAEMEAANG